MHMPELTYEFMKYAANIANETFVKAGIIPTDEEGFHFLLAVKLIDVSRNRRTREGHRRVLETAVRQIVAEHVVGFIEYRSKRSSMFTWFRESGEGMEGDDEKLSCDLIDVAKRSDALRYYVEHWLFENSRELFGERHTIVDKDGSKIIEHPMRVFTAYLNELDYVKAVDPSAYRNDAVRFRNVVALRRAGLAVLPPETWLQRVVLADGSLPRSEWKRTAVRALHWPHASR